MGGMISADRILSPSHNRSLSIQTKSVASGAIISPSTFIYVMQSEKRDHFALSKNNEIFVLADRANNYLRNDMLSVCILQAMS